MSKPSICVVYQQTRAGERAVRYAASLLRLTGSERLLVILQHGSGIRFSACARQSEEAREDQRSRVLASVAVLAEMPVDRLDFRCVTGNDAALVLPPDALVVTHSPDQSLSGVHVLHTLDEAGLSARGDGPILIPFGDGRSEMVAAGVGLPFAARVKRRVLFYHTTWRNPAVPSPDPADHVCDKARQNMALLTEMARSLSVECEFVVETADDVVEGIVHAAMRCGASLIVMSKGLKTTVGSYVTNALEQSPTPILVVADHPERRTA